MKHNKWGVIAVWLGIVAVVCGLFGAGYYFVGISTGWFGTYDGSLSGSSYSQSFEAALQPGALLEIDMSNPDVEIRVDSSLNGEIRAYFEGTRRGAQSIYMDKTARGVRFRSPDMSESFVNIGIFGFDRLRGTLTVYVPANSGIECDISTLSGRVSVNGLTTGELLSITSMSGAIHLIDVTSDKTELFSTSGRIDAKTCSFGDTELSTMSGAIALERTTTGDLSAFSTSGRIHLDGDACGTLSTTTMSGAVTANYASSGKADISTTSGRIELSLASDDISVNSMSGRISVVNAVMCDIDANTTSGAVHIIIPSLDDVSFDLSSVSGTISVDGRRIGNRYSDNGGRYEINADTMSGSIHIND